MIVQVGNLFSSRAQTLVNPVNCVGVMGKGLALEFKRRYPAMFQEYRYLCAAHQLRPGEPYLYRDLNGASILNFPTKDHWRNPSELRTIVSGLQWFRARYRIFGIQSIAFPALGCGNGGLPWETVGPVLYRYLRDLPIPVELYAPLGTPAEQCTEAFLRAALS